VQFGEGLVDQFEKGKWIPESNFDDNICRVQKE
jgi:hypothetical protein